MAIELLEAFTADFLEHQNLVCLYIVIEDCGLYHCSVDVGSTDFDSSVVLDEKHLVKFYISIFGLRKALDKDFVSSFDLELLACNVYNCVHKQNLSKVSGGGVRSLNGSFQAPHLSKKFGLQK